MATCIFNRILQGFLANANWVGRSGARTLQTDGRWRAIVR